MRRRGLLLAAALPVAAGAPDIVRTARASVLGFQPVTHRGMVSSIAPMALPAANAAALRDTSSAALAAPSGINHAIPGRWVRALLERR